VWFCAYVADFSINSLDLVIKLACELFICRSCLLSSWKKKEKKEEKVQKSDKNLGTNIRSHYLYLLSLIGLSMCYFTWLHICLGNEISALHIWIKILLGKTRIFISQVGLGCVRYHSWKKEKKIEQRRQSGKETAIASMLATWFTRVDAYLHMHQGLHIIAYCCVGEKWTSECILWLDCAFYLYILCWFDYYSVVIA